MWFPEPMVSLLYLFLQNKNRCDAALLLQLVFHVDPQFSIRLRSEEFPGESMTMTSFSLRKSLTFLEVWQGAPSCRTWLTLWISMKGSRWFSRTIAYNQRWINRSIPMVSINTLVSFSSMLSIHRLKIIYF